MKRIVLTLTVLALSPLAAAHPHNDTPDKPEETKRSWSYFGKKASEQETSDIKTSTLSGSEFAARLEKRFKKHTEKMERALKDAEAENRFLHEDRDINSAENIREAARALEDLVAESGVISSFADMMIDLASDFDVETNDDGLSLKFDGDRIGRLKIKRDKHTESTLDIEGFGRNMTVEKDVIRRNGKTKTRIIIEVDGDEEFDIDFRPKD